MGSEKENKWLIYSRYLADKASSLMRGQHLSQNTLAQKMNRTQQYVSHLLSGKENLTLETISLLGDALGADLLRALVHEVSNEPERLNVFEDEPACYSHINYSSSLETLESAEIVTRHFETGDRPFLVTCSDSFRYLCKAARSDTNAYGLTRELIGTAFSNIWGLSDTPMSLIRIIPGHIGVTGTVRSCRLPSLGRRWIENAVELKDTGHSFIRFDRDITMTLMKVALFDLWLSNEDRLNNNLNLLYSFEAGKIYAIDHAGIFNTNFSAPLLQLSICDSVLYSRLFTDAVKNFGIIDDDLEELNVFFYKMTDVCHSSVNAIWKMIPSEWRIDRSSYCSLIDFIFSRKWLDSTFSNFKEILKHCLI